MNKKPTEKPAKTMGRPPADIDQEKIKALMRLKPTLADTAAFFQCSEKTIENFIRKTWDLTFFDFRQQNMVHTRLNIVRKAISKAENGDNIMLIFCLKNLCDWSDRQEIKNEVRVVQDMSDEELREVVKLGINNG